MTIAHLLEDFELGLSSSGSLRLMPSEKLEEHRASAFEEGYSAGWDDAITAQADDQTQISADLSQSLQDIGFTYQEALVQLTVSLEPLFQSLIDTVLPEILEKSFAGNIVQQLNDMAREQATQSALLVVPSGAGRSLKPLLDREFPFSLQLVEEASLPPGQACLRIGNDEREVDCDGLIAKVSEAVGAFLQQAKAESQFG